MITYQSCVFDFVIDYGYLPADLNPVAGSSDDSTVPWYESDRTMFEVVRAEGYKLSNRLSAYDSTMKYVAGLATEDRSRYGVVPGTNDVCGLDGGTFRTTPPSNYPTWGTFG